MEAEAHRWRGEITESGRCAEEARATFAPGSISWCQAHVLWSASMSATGKLELVDRAAREALAITPENVIDAHVGLFAQIAGHAVSSGAYDLARRLCAAAEAAFERSTKSFAARAWKERARSVVTALDGDTAETAAAHAASASAAELAGDLRYACTERHNAGDLLKELGDYAGAEEVLRSMLVEAERLGLSLVAAAARNNLAFTLLRRGHIDDARSLVRRSIDDSARMGFRRFECFGRVYLAMMEIEAGDHEAAIASAKRATEELATAGPPMEPLARATMAKALLMCGRTAEALAAAQSAYDRFVELGAVEEGEAFLRLTYAEALEASGDRARSHEVVVAACERLFARAAKIRDEGTRRTFLESVPEHARTVELARPAS